MDATEIRETEIDARTYVVREARQSLRFQGTPDQMWRTDNRAAVAMVGEQVLIDLAALPNSPETAVAIRAAAEASL